MDDFDFEEFIGAIVWFICELSIMIGMVLIGMCLYWIWVWA